MSPIMRKSMTLKMIVNYTVLELLAKNVQSKVDI